MRSVAVAGVLAAVLFASGAHAVAAVRCGDIDPATKTRAKGVLVLDEKQAVTSVAFGRREGSRRLSLIFNVTGCEIEPSVQAAPRFDVLPMPGKADQLDESALKASQPVSDGSSYRQKFTVRSADLDPGTFTGVLVLDAPYLASNRTPITVSRSESNWLIPGGLGALAGLAGVVWFLLLKLAAQNKLKVSWRWLVLVIVLAVAAGIYAVLNVYWDQDVWTMNANGWAAAKAGFAGASTGSVAAVLAAIWRSDATTGGQAAGSPATPAAAAAPARPRGLSSPPPSPRQPDAPS
jgi:hypothetical protein